MSNTKDPFIGYITNFKYSDTSVNPLDKLKSFVDKGSQPCLINFITANEENELERGGIGKTYLLQTTRDFVVSRRFTADVDAKEIMPTIELAEQYITKQGLLSNIVDRLCSIDSRFNIEFTDFLAQNNEHTDEDPSFIAEKLFHEATFKFKKSENTKGGISANDNPFDTSNKLILFIDAFDSECIGSENVPFRKWLLEYLIPYLIIELNVTIALAGRLDIEWEKQEFVGESVEKKLYPSQIVTHQFELYPFEKKQLKDYLADYPNRLESGSITNIQIGKWKSLVNELAVDRNMAYIYKCTKGKPIFIDYFADLVLQSCIIDGEEDNLEDFIQKRKEASKEEQLDEGESFRKYIVQMLHYRKENNVGDRSKTAKAAYFLSLFKHGLNAKDFADLIENVDKKSKSNLLKDEQQVEKFFKDSFRSKNLSYVKSRIEFEVGKEAPVRLLHDEAVILLKKYLYDVKDENHSDRNNYIGFMLRIYERKLSQTPKLPLKEYNKKLLEYLEYSLTIYKKGKEQDAINRLLFEFSYYLDRHPDLCSRILEKGLNYYNAKKQLFDDRQEKHHDLTLTFANDFSLLAKLKMREAEYCLTVRGDGWDKRTKEIIAEVRDYANEDLNPTILLTDLQRLGLKARCLASEGEMLFWSGQWEEGKSKINESRELFYKTGESQGVIWTAHLLGFEAQRSGQFRLAARYHAAAIESALDSFSEAEKRITEGQRFGLHDYALLYRLRFLIRTIMRANSNWGVNLRYRGRILEAIKLLESNTEIAKLVGIREEARNSSNIAQFNAIQGVMSEFLDDYSSGLKDSLKVEDPLLPRRFANTRTILIGKQVGGGSDFYVKNRVGFSKKLATDRATIHAVNEVKQLEKVILENNTEGDENPLEYLQKNLPRQAKFLAIGKIDTNFSMTYSLSLPDSASYIKKYGIPMSREVADMYYQYGKMAMSSDLSLDKTKTSFEEARLAFENVRFVSDKATFVYLEMEACEALYRLSYLSNDKKNAKKHKQDFSDLRSLIGDESDMDKPKLIDSNEAAKNKANRKKYGIYFDLLAKFELTSGDFELDSALEDELYFDKPKELKQLNKSLAHYADALDHAHRHNQERYLLILDAVAERIKTIFEKGESVISINEIEQYLLAFFKKTEIWRRDSTFEIHLKTLLKATSLSEISQKTAVEDIKLIKSGIRKLAEKGKFIKAAEANNYLLNAYSLQGTENRKQLAFRYFQQFYFYLGASQHRIENLLTKMNKEFNLNYTEGRNCKTTEEAIYCLMSGIADYRTSEFWNMEKFILGELSYFRIKYSKKLSGEETENDEAAMKAFEAAEKKLIKAIEFLIEKKFNSSSSKRLIAEGLFRLGELYILMDLKKGDRAKVEAYLEEKILKTSLVSDEVNKKQRKQETHKDIHKDSPAIHTLNCAYYLAIAISDKHREIDALQSIANARYFAGQTVGDKADIYTDGIFTAHNKVRKEIKSENRNEDNQTKIGKDDKAANEMESDKNKFPIVIAKSYLVEGDIYFSQLFEIDTLKMRGENTELNIGKQSNRIHYKLRDEWQEHERSWEKTTKIKAILHTMFWNYLKGLDLLTDPDKTYENYHFNNMNYEINRRILYIQNRRLISMLWEDLPTIQDSFERLEDKSDIWTSLKFSMRIHELALASNAIFNNEK